MCTVEVVVKLLSLSSCGRWFTGLVLCAVASAASATSLVAWNGTSQRLLFFDSATPGEIRRQLALGEPSSGIRTGLAYRRASGRLLAVHDECGTTYEIDLRDGAIHENVGCVIGIPPPVYPSGADVDPVTGRLHVITSIHHYIPTSPNAEGIRLPTLTPADVNVVAIAYDLDDGSPSRGTLFGIDVAHDTLVRIGGPGGTPSPDLGVVTSIGALGVAVTDADLVIVPGHGAFARLRMNQVDSLYAIDLASGAASLIGTIGSGANITALAGLPAPERVPSASATGLLLIGVALLLAGFAASRRRVG